MSPETLDRKIAVARLVLGLERLWTALLWPLLVLGSAAALVISGVLPGLPALARFGLLALIAVLCGWSLRAVFRLKWPDRAQAIRHLEAGLKHRPVGALGDHLSQSQADQRTAALWGEHQLRQLRAVEGLQVAPPRSFWRAHDGRALRLPVALALFASVILGQGSFHANLAETLRPGTLLAATPVTLDAWLKPPAYTAKAPVMLTSPATLERLKTGSEILVPENSVLVLRVNGAVKPQLGFFELADGAQAQQLVGPVPVEKSVEGLYQSETKIARPLEARLMDGGRELARWRIAVIPDTPPAVSFTKEGPLADASGALTAHWQLSDDYGVTALTSEMVLSDQQDDGVGFEANGVFLYDPPKFPVALHKASPKSEEGKATADLTAHPWAGLMVQLTLEARDAAGHTTLSEAKTIRLPERLFTRPLARALIEQRKHLILDPDKRSDVVGMLEAMLVYPKDLIGNSGIHIAIATVVSRIDNARASEDIVASVQALWDIAVAVEDGTLGDAKAELQALREALERALADGAPPEKIEELMDKLRGALDRYMQSLMDEAQKNPQTGQAPQQGQPISPQDLQKMLDMIEKLSKSGANDAARELLAQLDEILRNLQPGQQRQQGQQGDNPLADMLDQLSEMMRRQQGLMDDTQRLPEDSEGMPPDQNGNPQGGQPSGPNALGDRQRGLAEMLQQLLDQLGEQGVEGPKSLGEAGRAMEGAEGALRQGDKGEALGQEGEALSKLRDGAQGLVQEMIRQGQGQQGSQGEHGEARGDDRDPLGRPMPNRSEDYGPERNMLPTEQAIRRAQEILDMLRSRANIPELPRIERDYIERLLRGLY